MSAITNQGRYEPLYSPEEEHFYSTQQARISAALRDILPLLSGETEDYGIAQKGLVRLVRGIDAFPNLLKDTTGNFCLRAKAIRTPRS